MLHVSAGEKRSSQSTRDSVCVCALGEKRCVCLCVCALRGREAVKALGTGGQCACACACACVGGEGVCVRMFFAEKRSSQSSRGCVCACVVCVRVCVVCVRGGGSVKARRRRGAGGILITQVPSLQQPRCLRCRHTHTLARERGRAGGRTHRHPSLPLSHTHAGTHARRPALRAAPAQRSGLRARVPRRSLRGGRGRAREPMAGPAPPPPRRGARQPGPARAGL